MATSNSKNPKRGRDFEKRVSRVLEAKYRRKFKSEKIKIGHPPKEHAFDLVSEDKKIVAECKYYSFTKTGNTPAAKMAVLNEAVFYLSHLPKKTEKLLILRRVYRSRSKNAVSLAGYYKRINNHLLSGVVVMELDVRAKCLVRK